MKEIRPLIDELLPELIGLRHDIHSYPEPAFEEIETAKKVVRHLERLEGIDIRTGVAKTGVVATLGAEKQGPCVALRADMDCLPVEEQTGKSYASKRPGFMHACGHDGHTTCLVGAAMVLAQLQDELTGPVKFLFQPAEEMGGGAEVMCREGALENPKVDAVFGLHGWPQIELGQYSLQSGPVMAFSDEFRIDVRGRGSHAAFPQHGIDPVLIAAHIVVALQSVVSRSTSPLDSLVVGVSVIQGGTVKNVMPSAALLKGTIRSFLPEVRENAFKRMRAIAESTAAAYGGEAELTIIEGYKAVVNDERCTEFFRRAAFESVGERGYVSEVFPVMASEDFCYYQQRVPGSFWGLGVRPKGADSYPSLHNAGYDFPDEAIALGVQLHCEAARRFAGQWQDA